MPYLRFAIQSVLDSHRQDFELIVSVNGPSDNSIEFLSSINDNRLRVVFAPKVLQMSRNYEYALSFAEGDWVQLIGSDDGLQGWYFDAADRLISDNPQINIFSWARAYYYWPGANLKEKHRSVDAEFSDQTEIRSFNLSYLGILFSTKSIFDVPQLYTGSLVSRKLLETIKTNSGGNFYHSIIPDVYSGVCLFLNSKYYLFSKLPLTWVGTSSLSMGKDGKIYNDVANSVDSDSLTLAIGVDQNIHASEYSSYYILEALYQYPVTGAKQICSLLAFKASTVAAAARRYELRQIHTLLRQTTVRTNYLIVSICILIPLSFLFFISFLPLNVISRASRKFQKLFSSRIRVRFVASQDDGFVGFSRLNSHLSTILAKNGIIVGSLE